MKSVALLLLVVMLAGCTAKSIPVNPVSPTDESLIDNAGGRKTSDFPELDDDVFHKMDAGMIKPSSGSSDLTADEVKGRNTWNLWCGGNEQFWDRIASEELGLFDLLKTLDSRKHDERFKTLGLINQPGFKQASKPDKHGLWIDEAVSPEPASIDQKVYGRPSGVMGFRLFDNPDFAGEAVKHWDAEKYYNDSQYATKKGLIRPYRVGVACGSCHIAFNPLSSPKDVNNPDWENLASAIGNQYIHEGGVFAPNVKPGGFFWEIIRNQPRGTSDTSRIATDHINNPNAINPIFELAARASIGEEETVSGETLLIPGEQKSMKVPHILKDGADSVGVPGATIRVYINIGLYSQHWLQQHNALIGLTPQKPFSIKTAQKNSVYWLATQEKVANIAKFFMRLKSTRLEDAKEPEAKDGKEYITQDELVMNKGKLVFAQQCATCHSSKQPPPGENADEWFAKEVVKPDFRDDNFFSDERRYPVTEIETNASRALGTNAKRGHVWNYFSSDTYKTLKSPGSISVWNPYTDAEEQFAVPEGGTGFYRTPSLIACWTSAPFFHNNALGTFSGNPSIAGRVKDFEDAAQKLLWPEKRLGKQSVWRTSGEIQFTLHGDYIPEPLRSVLRPKFDPDGFFRIAHIPEGLPINLLANLDPDADPKNLAALLLDVKLALLKIKLEHLEGDAARKVLQERVAPALWKVNKCPDFIEDRGHYFGTDLPDDDKLALIEYLKTL